jgi:hypothetical protein
MSKIIIDGIEIEKRIDDYAANPHSDPVRVPDTVLAAE